MEAVDLEMKRAGDDQVHDMEKATGEVVSGGDAKRPRMGNDDCLAMEMDAEEKELGPHEIFEMYREEWMISYGKNDAASFYKPTELQPMRHTEGPLLPTFVKPMDTMEVFFIKVTRLTGGLQWPLDVYGDVAVRDSLDHMRNYLFRRDRNNCQTLTSRRMHSWNLQALAVQSCFGRAA